MKKRKLLTIILAFALLVTTLAAIPVTTQAKSLKVTCKTNTIKNKKIALKKGKSAKLIVKFGIEDVTKQAKYKSSKPKVIKVTKKGKLKALKKGTAKIKVTYKKKTVTLKVTCKTTTSTKICSHNWNKGKVTRKATCQQTGIKTYSCKRCGQTKTETIPKTDHKIVVTHKDSTCTTEGWEKKECQICHKVFSQVKYQKVPHDNNTCKFCSYTNYNLDTHIHKIHAKNMYYPKDCPRHYWEYENCFYCGTPNPQPGVLKGWETNYRNQTCRNPDNISLFNNISGHHWNGNHYCNECGIEEPYWVENFCGTCRWDFGHNNGKIAKQIGVMSLKDCVWSTLDMPYWDIIAHMNAHYNVNHTTYPSMTEYTITYSPTLIEQPSK